MEGLAADDAGGKPEVGQETVTVPPLPANDSRYCRTHTCMAGLPDKCAEFGCVTPEYGRLHPESEPVEADGGKMGNGFEGMTGDLRAKGPTK